MSKIILLLLICLVRGKDYYKELISEKVTEEYCNEVISNIIGIINDAYIYLDYYKVPSELKPNNTYKEHVDLIKELNEINKTNTTFYEFYRNIQKTISKTRDGHFFFYTRNTPNNFNLSDFGFCSPFTYVVKENISENLAYLSIEPNYFCSKPYTNETIDKIKKLEGKKIKTIKGKDPYDYIDYISLLFDSLHSPQGRYAYYMNNLDSLSLCLHPYLKEELNVSIEFEDSEDEGNLLQIEYTLVDVSNSNGLIFKKFYEEQKKKYFENYMKYPNIKDILLQYKMKNELIDKNEFYVEWEINTDDFNFLCRVDDENEMNIIVQKSFGENFTDYEDKMLKCLEKIYSNNYKIVVVENLNNGGFLIYVILLVNIFDQKYQIF